jgi:hypothetical protein
MKKIALSVALIALTSPALAQYYGTGSNPSDHYVQGHSRSNGSYVQPHYQTNPNSYGGDNYNASGNYNYHNGSSGHHQY